MPFSISIPYAWTHLRSCLAELFAILTGATNLSASNGRGTAISFAYWQGNPSFGKRAADKMVKSDIPACEVLRSDSRGDGQPFSRPTGVAACNRFELLVPISGSSFCLTRSRDGWELKHRCPGIKCPDYGWKGNETEVFNWRAYLRLATVRYFYGSGSVVPIKDTLSC